MVAEVDKRRNAYMLVYERVDRKYYQDDDEFFQQQNQTSASDEKTDDNAEDEQANASTEVTPEEDKSLETALQLVHGVSWSYVLKKSPA